MTKLICLPLRATEQRVRNGTPYQIFTANEENAKVRKYSLQSVAALTFVEVRGNESLISDTNKNQISNSENHTEKFNYCLKQIIVKNKTNKQKKRRRIICQRTDSRLGKIHGNLLQFHTACKE